MQYSYGFLKVFLKVVEAKILTGVFGAALLGWCSCSCGILSCLGLRLYFVGQMKYFAGLDICLIVTCGGRPYQHSKVVKILGIKYYMGMIEFSWKEYPCIRRRSWVKTFFEGVQNKLLGSKSLLLHSKVVSIKCRRFTASLYHRTVFSLLRLQSFELRAKPVLPCVSHHSLVVGVFAGSCWFDYAIGQNAVFFAFVLSAAWKDG